MKTTFPKVAPTTVTYGTMENFHSDSFRNELRLNFKLEGRRESHIKHLKKRFLKFSINLRQNSELKHLPLIKILPKGKETFAIKRKEKASRKSWSKKNNR